MPGLYLHVSLFLTGIIIFIIVADELDSNEPFQGMEMWQKGGQLCIGRRNTKKSIAILEDLAKKISRS